jgi:eukaryotic-like serine/threonine-protein kinase
MDQDRWKEVNRIFHAALAVSVSERHEFVISLAHGDEDIQAEVELLLRADQSARSYLETPLLKAQPLSSESALLHPGDELCGRFRVLREIAEGGMGQVYEAFDSELGVHVAIK